MNYLNLLLVFCFFLIGGNLCAQDNDWYQFVSPKPESMLVSNQSNIIVRSTNIIDKSTFTKNTIKVTGSKSGDHSGELILSDDNKTIVFNPKMAFADNEKVNVAVKGIMTSAQEELPEYSFYFTTAPKGTLQITHTALIEDDPLAEVKVPNHLKSAKTDVLLPAPPITIDSINSPSPGYIFMATWDRNVPAIYGNFIFILDKNAEIVDSIRVNGAPYDFQVQPNGLLTYALGDFSSNVPLPGEDLRHIVMDENLTVIDTFKMKNGYTADFHEFKMLPNGHAMMMSYYTIPYDMSTIVDGGNPEASLVINIIQEQDREKNVVFEWRNIDYIPITESDLDLTDARINYSTLNAFDLDDDGNILASFRNHSEIMKISRTTGEIIWRMGSPRGEFTYVGEHEENAPYYHARQHNIRRRPNGNITLFDNGQFHQPPYSRAVEYQLDEVNKVATLVSEWRYPDGNIFCVTAGNAEMLPNGGWFIGYGVPNKQFVKRNAVEVHPNGDIALELTLPDGVLAYRVTKLPWKETVNKHSFTHYEVREGNTYSFNNESITTGIEVKYNSLEAPDYNEYKITRFPYSPVYPEFVENMITINPVSIVFEGYAISSQSSEFHIDLSAYPEIKDPENTVVYYRTYPKQGLFIAKPTTYDEENNELVVSLNGFGEIVFGVPDNSVVNNIPILYEPANQQELTGSDTITLRWTGKGMYDSFNIQVSTDTLFSTVNYETNTNLSDFTVGDLARRTKYFWRVKSLLESQSSDWSPVWSFILTGTSDASTIKSNTASLEQNFPNPFSTTTTIYYSVQKPNLVSLKIYDQRGREVKTLISKEHGAGTYSIVMDSKSLPNGIYYYRLQVGNEFSDTKKMVLIGK